MICRPVSLQRKAPAFGGRWSSRSGQPLNHWTQRRAGSNGADKGEGVTRRLALGEWVAGTAEGTLRFVGTAAAGVAAIYGGAKFFQLGQPRKPPLAGPIQSVGSEIVKLGGLRCRVFYPAASVTGKEAPYLTEGTGTSSAMAGLVFFPGFLLEHLGVAGSGCIEGAPPALPTAGAPQYPVLVFSHGQGGNMDMQGYLLREFASFGLVAVSIEHQDGSSSTDDPKNPRPFGRFGGQLGVQASAEEMLRVAIALQTDDKQSGAARWGGDPAGLIASGHSYGGPTALIAASLRPDLFRGLVLHDPATTNSPKPTLPVFSVVGDQYAGIGSLVNEVRRVSSGQVEEAAIRDRPGLAWAGAWKYGGISHGNFVDAPLWAPLFIMRLLGLLLIPAAGPADPVEAHARLAESGALFARACCGNTSLLTGGGVPSAPFERV